MTLLRGWLFNAIFYPGSLVAVLGALAVSRDPDRTQVHARRWARFHHWCTRTLLGIETRVEGTIPSGPVLFAVKHQAMYETFEMIRLLRRPVVVLKQELLSVPLWGRVVEQYGAIPVDRAGSASALRTMLKAARAAVAAGRPLLIFPEGTRVAVGETPPLRAGFAGLYRVANLPVVPIALDSGRVWPRHGARRAGVVTLRVCPTIPAGLPRDEIEALVHAAINVLEPAAGQPSAGGEVTAPASPAPPPLRPEIR